jgi:hypothetical protein
MPLHENRFLYSETKKESVPQWKTYKSMQNSARIATSIAPSQLGHSLKPLLHNFATTPSLMRPLVPGKLDPINYRTHVQTHITAFLLHQVVGGSIPAVPWFGDQLWLCGLIPYSALVGVRE